MVRDNEEQLYRNQTRQLVTNMLETIPLWARLGIDCEFIIKSNEALLTEILDTVFVLQATKAGVVQVMHCPVKLNMLSQLDFRRSGFEDLRSEEVQR